MTVVVVVFMPLVLLYQAWSYYVFRRRVSASDFAPIQEKRHVRQS
jgi:cytochrome d ubiquinol oxidase subunit II